jgi:hypothetical protein
VSSLPLLVVGVLAVGSPAVTALLTVRGQNLNRGGTREQEDDSRRQEVMTTLRWAAELAVSDDVRKARLGIQELKALQNSPLIGTVEGEFIIAALDAALEVPVLAIEQAGGDVEVVATAGSNDLGEVLVPSEEESAQEERPADAQDQGRGDGRSGRGGPDDRRS